jgi:hypothetical protein
MDRPNLTSNTDNIDQLIPIISINTLQKARGTFTRGLAREISSSEFITVRCCLKLNCLIRNPVITRSGSTPSC